MITACPHTERKVRSKGMCSSCYMKQVPSRSPGARRRARDTLCQRESLYDFDKTDADRTEAYKNLLLSTTDTENTGHITAMARALSGENSARKDGGVHQIHRTMKVHTECLGWALNLNAEHSFMDPCAGSGQILEVLRAKMGLTKLISNDLNFDPPEWYAREGVPHTKHDVFGPSANLPRADFVVCSPPYIVCEYVMKRLVKDRKARIGYIFHTTTDFLTNANFARRSWWDVYELDKQTTLRIEGLPVNAAEGANKDEVTVQQRRNAWCIIFTSKAWKRKICKCKGNVTSFHRLRS